MSPSPTTSAALLDDKDFATTTTGSAANKYVGADYRGDDPEAVRVIIRLTPQKIVGNAAQPSPPSPLDGPGNSSTWV